MIGEWFAQVILVCFTCPCLRVLIPLIDWSVEVVSPGRKDNNHRHFISSWEQTRTGNTWALRAMGHQLLLPSPKEQGERESVCEVKEDAPNGENQEITMHPKRGAASALGPELWFPIASKTWLLLQTFICLCMEKILTWRISAPVRARWLAGTQWRLNLTCEFTGGQGSPCPVYTSGSLTQGAFQRDLESSWTRGSKTSADDTQKTANQQMEWENWIFPKVSIEPDSKVRFLPFWRKKYSRTCPSLL